MLSFMAGWQFGLLMSVAIVLAIVCFMSMYSDKDMMKNYMQSLEEINSQTVEYVRGILQSRSFGLGIESFEKFHEGDTKLFQNGK